MRNSLKWGAIASIPLVLLSLLPQFCLWFARGSQWQGAYATIDGDEFLYSAYLNALIDGRPRRNDPFGGRDDHPKAPLQESTFSIQFIPPFVIVGLARVFRLSASSTFILLLGIAGFAVSVSVFWLLLRITGNNRVSSVGTLFILCVGGIVAGQGILGVSVGAEVTSLGLPFLRRYQPAATFSLLFVFFTLVFSALNAKETGKARLYSGVAGLTLAVLIYCYLYLWTAAVAWVLSCILLWMVFRPLDRRRAFDVLTVVGSIFLSALVPYLYLLSHRARNLDKTQTLISTQRLDLLRVPEIVAFVVLLFLVIAIRRGKLKKNRPSIIFALSFCVLPFVLFNQQVLTGRSMQPFHFENFVANYVVLVSLVIVVAVYNRLSSRALLWTAVLCLSWGFVETYLPARARSAADVANDEMVPVLMRLKTLSFQDGTRSDLHNNGQTHTMVFSPEVAVLRLLPSFTAQGVAVGLGRLDFGSATAEESKVFEYLYFCGIDATEFRNLLHDQTSDLLLNYYTRSAVFGHERVLQSLSAHHQPIEDREIEEFVRRYENYCMEFNRDNASKEPMTYLVIRQSASFDFSRIDLWYERAFADHAGGYDLYRLRLRTN